MCHTKVSTSSSSTLGRRRYACSNQDDRIECSNGETNTRILLDVRSLARSAHVSQMSQVQAERFGKRAQAQVLHAVLTAYVLHDWSHSWVVVLRNPGEEVVHRLIVQGAGHESCEPVSMRVVDTRFHLRDRPFVVDRRRIVITVWEISDVRDVAHLKVEGQPVTGHNLSDQEQHQKLLHGHLEIVQGHDDPPTHPEHLDQDKAHKERVVHVDSDRAVCSTKERIGEVLETELEPENPVQRRKVDVLPLVQVGPQLASHDTARVTAFDDRHIRVRSHHVCVDVVSNHMLVMPRHHACTGVPVHCEAPSSLPPRLRRPKSSMGRVVHHVQEWQSLANAEDHRSYYLRRKTYFDDAVHCAVAQRRSGEDESHAPQPWDRVTRVKIVVREVLTNPLAHFAVEPRVIGLVLWKLGVHDHPNLEFGEHLLRLVGERVVGRHQLGAVAPGSQQEHLTSSRVAVKP
mmetsp:Transcript_83336/g.202061  ORF Transcript_83336/g.202061 Transcript_83336/m.202061 type:complete len:458 (+) Transcript_83336:299-1672(+)